MRDTGFRRLAKPLVAALGALGAWRARISGRSWVGKIASRLNNQAQSPTPPVSRIETAPAGNPRPLDVDDLAYWVASRGILLGFRHRGDLYQLSASGLKIQLPGNRWELTSPRLVFWTSDGLPVLEPSDLDSLDPEASPYQACFTIDGGGPISWDALAQKVSNAITGYFGEVDLLLKRGLVDPDVVDDAVAKARPNESVEATLFRLGTVSFATWVDAFNGREFSWTGTHRPFSDRLGMRLLKAKTISQSVLKRALERQGRVVGSPRLGDLLGLPRQQLDEVAATQRQVEFSHAAIDSPPELLIRWKCMKRSDWLADWLASREDGSVAMNSLITTQKVLPSHLRRADAYRDSLHRHLLHSANRLGYLLNDRGLDRETIGKALAWQVDQPFPLAELLVVHRILGPADAARALAQQAMGYRLLACGELAPLETSGELLGGTLPESSGLRKRPPPGQFPRGYFAVAAFFIFALAYSVAFGLRLGGVNYGWWNSFFPEIRRSAPWYRPPGGAVYEVSEFRTSSNSVAVEPIERLNLPLGAKRSGQFSQTEPSGTPTLAAVPSWAPSVTPNQMAIPVPLVPSVLRDHALTRGYGQIDVNPELSKMATGGIHAFEQRVPTPGPSNAIVETAPSQAEASPARWQGRPDTPVLSLTYPVAPLLKLSPPPGRPPGLMAEKPAQSRRHPIPLGGAAMATTTTVRRSQAMFRARIAEAYWREGDVRAAQAELRGAIHDDPTFARPYYFLGETARTQNKRQVAIKAFSDYLRLAPEAEFSKSAREALAQMGARVPGY